MTNQSNYSMDMVTRDIKIKHNKTKHQGNAITYKGNKGTAYWVILTVNIDEAYSPFICMVYQ